MTGGATPNNDLLNRLSRIEGQVCGIAKMVKVQARAGQQ